MNTRFIIQFFIAKVGGRNLATYVSVSSRFLHPYNAARGTAALGRGF